MLQIEFQFCMQANQDNTVGGMQLWFVMSPKTAGQGGRRVTMETVGASIKALIQQGFEPVITFLGRSER